VVLTLPHEFFKFIGYAVLIFLVVFMSRVPVVYILKRSMVVFPFVFLVVIFVPFYKADVFQGMYKYSKFIIVWNVLIKSWLAVLAMTILTATTKFSILLKGFEKLKIPKILIMCLSFMYRYIFVLVDEVQRFERARSSRYFGGKLKRQIKVIANIIGLLFIRTYERAERVYQNMISRGFDGKTRTINNLNFSVFDVFFCFVFLSILLLIKIQG